MILDRLDVDPAELKRRTGWEIQPEGACKAGRCVPLGENGGGRGATAGAGVDARMLAEQLGMALVHDERHGVWALGPESGGRALASAELPAIELPDRDGNVFSLDSLRGMKVLLVAWASW